MLQTQPNLVFVISRCFRGKGISSLRNAVKCVNFTKYLKSYVRRLTKNLVNFAIKLFKKNIT